MDLQTDTLCHDPGCDALGVLGMDGRWLCKDHALLRMSWLLALSEGAQEQDRASSAACDRLLAILFWVAAIELLALIIAIGAIRAHHCA